MTTLIVKIEHKNEAQKIANELLQRGKDGVIDVFIEKSDISDRQPFDLITGLPYSYEERLADIQRAEDDFAMGRTSTSFELKKRLLSW